MSVIPMSLFVRSLLKDVTLCSFSLCRPCLHTLVFNDARKKNDVLTHSLLEILPKNAF